MGRSGGNKKISKSTSSRSRVNNRPGDTNQSLGLNNSLDRANLLLGVDAAAQFSDQIASGSIDGNSLLTYSHFVDDSIRDAISRRDVRALAAIMKAVDPSFKDEQFINNALSPSNYPQGFVSGGERRQNEEGDYKNNKDSISKYFIEAGGSQGVLDCIFPYKRLLSAATGFENRSDVDVNSYDDSGSDLWFIDQDSGTFRGNLRTYSVVINGEDRNVDVKEVQNEDGQAIKLSSHGVEVVVSQTASHGDDGPLIEYDDGSGRKKVSSDDWSRFKSLEHMAMDILEDKVVMLEVAANRAETQSSRLFDAVS